MTVGSLTLLVSLARTGPQAGRVFYFRVPDWLGVATPRPASPAHENFLSHLDGQWFVLWPCAQRPPQQGDDDDEQTQHADDELRHQAGEQ